MFNFHVVNSLTNNTVLEIILSENDTLFEITKKIYELYDINITCTYFINNLRVDEKEYIMYISNDKKYVININEPIIISVVIDKRPGSTYLCYDDIDQYYICKNFKVLYQIENGTIIKHYNNIVIVYNEIYKTFNIHNIILPNDISIINIDNVLESTCIDFIIYNETILICLFNDGLYVIEILKYSNTIHIITKLSDISDDYYVLSCLYCSSNKKILIYRENHILYIYNIEDYTNIKLCDNINEYGYSLIFSPNDDYMLSYYTTNIILYSITSDYKIDKINTYDISNMINNMYLPVNRNHIEIYNIVWFNDIIILHIEDYDIVYIFKIQSDNNIINILNIEFSTNIDFSSTGLFVYYDDGLLLRDCDSSVNYYNINNIIELHKSKEYVKIYDSDNNIKLF